MEYKNILLNIEDQVATITFNRPKVLNAMNYEVVAEIYDAVNFCAKNEDVRSLIFTGAGEKAFVAGADISQMQNAKLVDILEMMEMGHKTMRLIETLPKPSIAAVNGFALGGGTEIALACDIRFASEKAVFGQPEILIGIIPGWGGTQRLSRLVGMGLAKEIILTGAQINAARAYEIGLVNKIFPADKLMEETKKFAQKFAALPAFALKMAKNAMNYGFDMSLDNASALEIGAIAQCFATEDQKEGMSAFLEKRKPNFKGR